MSFPLACPNCDATFQVPDEVAGKRIRCKKCGEILVARRKQTEEVDEPRPSLPPNKVKKSPPSPNRRSHDDEEDEAPVRKSTRPSRQIDDDDLDEPRPRPKKRGKKSKKKAASPVLLFVLLGVGTLVVLGGGAAAIYFGFVHEPKKSEMSSTSGGGSGTVARGGGDASATAGWIMFEVPGGAFRVKLPGQPGAPQITRQPLPTGEVMEAKLFPVNAGSEAFIAGYMLLPGAAASIPPDQMLEGAINGGMANSKGAVVKSRTTVTYQGHPGREAILEFPGKKGSLVMRVIHAKDRLIMLVAAGDAVAANAPRVHGFFQSVVID